jgi:hypothetical protein
MRLRLAGPICFDSRDAGLELLDLRAHLVAQGRTLAALRRVRLCAHAASKLGDL